MTDLPSATLTPGTSSGGGGLALTVPFFAIIAWSIGLYGYLDMPGIIASVVAVLFPVICLAAVGRLWRDDPGLKLQTALFGMVFAWILLCLLIHPQRLAIGLGWVATDFAGLSLFLAVATGGLSSDRGFQIAGVTAACSVAVAFAGCLSSHSSVFGMGNINFLMSASTPTLLALAVLVAHRLWHGRAQPITVVVVTVLGLAILMSAVLFTPFVRRGPVAATGAVLILLALQRCYRTAPRLVVALLVVAVIASGCALFSIMTERLPPFRLDRVFIYRSALERIHETWAVGSGPYGCLRFADSSGEYARHWTAVGHWSLHAHNELLDAVLSAGVLGGLFWIVSIGAIIVRITRIADAGERMACSALFIALMVHAMTDNSYAIQAPRMMYYSSFGLVFLCPLHDRPWRSALGQWTISRLRALPSPRALAWFGAGCGLMVAVCEMPGALTLCHAAPETYLNDMRWAVLPDNVNDEFAAAFPVLLQDGKFASAKRAVDLGAQRLGMFGPFVSAMVDLSKQHLDHVEQDPRLWGEQTAAAHDLEVRETVQAHCLALRTFPFSLSGYDHLSAIVDRHPEAISEVPPAMLPPLAYITGHGTPAPLDQFTTARSMDDAIALYAQLIWWQRSGQSMLAVRAPLLDLVSGYGDVPDVARLGLALAASGPLDGSTLRRLHDPLALGLLYYTPPATQADEITRGAHDAARHDALPGFSTLIAGIFPAYWLDFTNHACAGDEEEPLVRNACMRLFAQAAHQPGGKPQ